MVETYPMLPYEEVYEALIAITKDLKTKDHFGLIFRMGKERRVIYETIRSSPNALYLIAIFYITLTILKVVIILVGQ